MPAINLTGDTLWNKTILGKDNYEMFLYVNILSLLGSPFLFVASYLNPDSDHLDVMCLKLDVDGNMIWSKTFDFGSTAEPYAVIQTIDKGFIITGRILQDVQPHRKILVLKLDSSGEVQWSKMMAGGDVVNQAYSMKQSAVLKATEIKADLSGSPGGIYFLRIRNNNKVYSRKIVRY
ncbi:MAG: T9SS type A sorting domain-containing protein [Bacteroidales bacterium]|nr:T9SS type A sorting domain-containing protein [Bacteroidales bacterium]